MPFSIGGPWNQASVCNGFGDIQRRMLRNDLDTISKQRSTQGHSFWYQSISHILLPIGCHSSLFCSRTHRLATIHSIQMTTDRRKLLHKHDRTVGPRLKLRVPDVEVEVLYRDDHIG